ncbi:acyl-homoserine-lactone synthase [Sphingobium sp. D43FB]|uniref:acyl-homoserine-lactone synthase n=1 Tax=Sphingobium sp. D43FB TaxID=2017595 RepID=UPI000BB53798|nr:acyl-homoserine-lactone synthase [Sphingobium sp. D43FB]PBN43527.1 autoinducer synthase [Sphingobium sp. D43FB]
MPSVQTGVSTRVPDALLADMYRDRKRVFIDLLGWDLPALDDRFEIDQFDGPDTLYLIVGSPDDNHLGSIRLLPTDRPTVIGEIFDHLCEAGAPASPRIWELSRLCLSPRIRAARRREVRNRLLTSAVKIAMENGATHLCCVIYAWYMPEVLSYGWRCRPLGLPQPDPSGLVIALEIVLDGDTRSLMTQAGTWDETPAAFSRDGLASRGEVQ